MLCGSAHVVMGQDGSLEGLSASAMRIVVRTCLKAGRWREALAVVAMGRWVGGSGRGKMRWGRQQT